MSDFTYKIPVDFDSRVERLLRQKSTAIDLAGAFRRCSYEHDDKGLAYYAGMHGDNWDKHALDFVFEGERDCIDKLERNRKLLKDSLEKALRPSLTGLLVREVSFLESDYCDPLTRSNGDRLNADIETARAVLKDVMEIGERLCSSVTFTSESPENSINDYLRDAFCFKGYTEVKDQSRHGLSASGKDAGEVDILLSKAGRDVAIIEGMKLNSVNTSYIDEHITKALVNYNPLGTATFLIAYVSVSDFGSFWERYTEHLREYPYQLRLKRQFQTDSYPNASARVATMVLSRDDYDFPAYFVAFKLLK